MEVKLKLLNNYILAKKSLTKRTFFFCAEIRIMNQEEAIKHLVIAIVVCSLNVGFLIAHIYGVYKVTPTQYI